MKILDRVFLVYALYIRKEMWKMINFYFSDKDYDDNLGLLGIFDWAADNSWYDDLAIKIINDVDKTEVIAPNVFRSEYWGTFPKGIYQVVSRCYYA